MVGTKAMWVSRCSRRMEVLNTFSSGGLSTPASIEKRGMRRMVREDKFDLC